MRANFAYVVRRVQDEVEAEHKRSEDDRAVKGLTATIQREIRGLLMSAGPVSYEDASKPSTGMARAFSLHFGKQSDRPARKSPPVTVIYQL